ncbi:MAG: DUF362 domain-containing protein [Thermoanaerobaculales bacterium]|nr:DUF362 domain-containing protein [Thermoanaerobaculales bacterium]
MTRDLSRRDLGLFLAGLASARILNAGEASFTRAAGRVGTARIAAGARKSVFFRAVGEAVARSVGVATPEAAISRLVKPSDTVGIKVNCLGGPRMSPRPEVVEALVELVAGVGVERRKIVVFERLSRELENAGFTLYRNRGPYRCFGIDNDYEREPTVAGSVGSCFARLVTTTCTALISVGVVKDHDFAGISAGLKNWYGVIHNPNKYHDGNCDPYVADVVRSPFIGSKLRLTVLDGARAQYRGGPAFARRGVFDLGLVAASTDPVAADAWAWKEIDLERGRHGLPTLEEQGRPPRFIATAHRYGLGQGERKALQVIAG